MQQERLVKRLKRAFTITELVIVIAVIAILAAVLIPTFMNVTKKAQQSADNQLVKNLNTILTSEAAIEGKNKTCYDAIQDAAEGGYQVDKITPTSDGDILWDSVNDCFVLYSEGAYQYVGVETPKTATADSAFVKIYNNKVQYGSGTESASANGIVAYAAEENGFSAYLGEGSIDETKYTAENPLKVSVGIDTGDYNIDVTYNGTGTDAVIIRVGVAATLTVTSGTVNQYGEALEVVVNGGTVTVNGDTLVNAKSGTVTINSKETKYLKSEYATVWGGTVVSSDDYNTERAERKEAAEKKAFENNAANASYVARIGLQGYDTVQAAIDAAGSTKTSIALTNDCTVDKDITIAKDQDIVLDLNGKTITRSTVTVNKKCCAVVIEGTLTIDDSKGGGIIELDCKKKYVLEVSQGGKLTINGGTFANKESGGYSICAYKAAVTTINGGIFDGLFNRKNGATITINAGTFKNQSGTMLGNITECCAAGKGLVKKSSEVYEVSADVTMVAKIENAKYASLKQAIYHAATNDTISLIDNYDGSEAITISSSKTLTISIDAGVKYSLRSVTVKRGGELNLEGSGTLQVETPSSIDIYDGGTLVAKNCTLSKISDSNDNTTPVVENKGTATFTDCTISTTKAIAITNKNNGVLTVEGGRIVADWYGVDTAAGANLGNAINVMGGEATFNDSLNSKLTVESKMGSVTTLLKNANNKTEPCRAIYIAGGATTIKGGTFKSLGCECIYICLSDTTATPTTATTTLTITGGTFDITDRTTEGTDYVLNIENSQRAQVKVSITGGTFYGFNPSKWLDKQDSWTIDASKITVE